MPNWTVDVMACSPAFYCLMVLSISGCGHSGKPSVQGIVVSHGSWWYRKEGVLVLNLEPLFFTCAWNVTLLADALGLESREFRRMVKRSVGLNPKDWLRRIRVVSAMHLLREGGKIETIARQLGFRHASDFSNEFRSLVGVNPSCYVKSEMSRSFPMSPM